ncbi:MAG: hypothetical protein V2B19_29720 [Pseudomonadota bacterium]
MKRGLDFMGFNYNCLVLATILIAVFGQASTSEGGERLLVRPAEDVTIRSEAKVSLKPFEIRKGGIILDTQFLPQPTGAADSEVKAAVSAGDTEIITFFLFADVTYEATIDSVVQHPDGTKIIHARLIDHKIGTVVLTIGSDGFLITLQDMNKALLYRVAGDPQSSEGTATEIDMTKIPPMIR